jgi:uncharacterized repeat protein (TIGR03803 family)
MNIKLLKIRLGLISFALGMALPLNAQVLTTALHNFAGSPSDGAGPGGVLLTNGIIYGTSAGGGSLGYGTVFSFSTNNGGSFTVLHNFTNPPDGLTPNDLVSDGTTLYGTTQNGGTNGYGMIFRIGTNGLNYTNLWSFTSQPDGEYPQSGLILNGATLYGTTSGGGSNPNGDGTIFKIGTNGKNYTILHNFTNSPDGQSPRAGLVLNGATLYGTTYLGGTNSAGLIFKMDTNGLKMVILHTFSFDTADGAYPQSTLSFNNNVLYGTTFLGGSSGVIGNGTIFRIDTNTGASFTVLHSFSSMSFNTNADGAHPLAGVVVNTNTIYGTAANGGSYNAGTVFQVNTNGSGFLVLKNFTNAPDGNGPQGGLALSGKNLYGMSYSGGSSSNGLAFSLLLSPAIITQPQDQTATNGFPFDFTVAACGAPTLNYQWYFHTNTAIVNATNAELDYAAATNSLAGYYRVIITNSYGSVTSSFAALTVVAAPVIPSTPVILGVNFNSTNGSFSLSVSNTANSTNRLWASTNLISTNFWKVIATNVQAANGLWSFTDTNTARTNAARFYRFSTP